MARCVFCREDCRENGFEGRWYRFAVCERCLEIADRIDNMADAIESAVILSRETVIDGHILRMIEDGVLEKDDYEVREE